ncbi:MAG: hypothetical protein AB9903_14370 [Vulcanimicrobiota bacterium]
MSMTLGNINSLPQLPSTAQTAPDAGAPKQEQTPPAPQDNVTIGSVATKAAKVIVGVPAALVAGTIKGGIESFQSSVKSAHTGLGIELNAKDAKFGEKFTSLLLNLSPMIGAAIGSSGGPLGMVLGAMAGPGFVGGSIAAWGGGFAGIGEGVDVAKALGNKAQEKVAPKMGEFAGKAAKVVTSIATGLIAAPLFGISKAIDSSFDFAKKAVGIDKKPATKAEVPGQLMKLGAITFGYLNGLLGATGGIVNVILGGAQGVGSAATIVAGAEGGVKAFKEGAREGYDMGGKLIDKMVGR